MMYKSMNAHQAYRVTPGQAKSRLVSQAMHNCSNADTCELGTNMCNRADGHSLTEMSNQMRRNN